MFDNMQVSKGARSCRGGAGYRCCGFGVCNYIGDRTLFVRSAVHLCLRAAAAAAARPQDFSWREEGSALLLF